MENMNLVLDLLSLRYQGDFQVDIFIREFRILEWSLRERLEMEKYFGEGENSFYGGGS